MSYSAQATAQANESDCYSPTKGRARPPYQIQEPLGIGDEIGRDISKKALSYLSEMAELFSEGESMGEPEETGYFTPRERIYANGNSGQRKPINIIPSRGPPAKSPPKSKDKPGWIQRLIKKPHEIKHTPSKSHQN